MQEHQRRLHAQTLEFCLQTAAPVTADPNIVPFARTADRLTAALRPLPRHLDLALLARAWRRLAHEVNRAQCDIVLAHPCQYLQAPLALRWIETRSVYFCHEPRRVDYEQAAAASVNRRTRWLYAGLYRMERKLDRLGVFSSDQLVTNSDFTAGRIEQAYGRVAEPIPMGVADLFREPGSQPARTHLLSVGTLIPAKGHDLAIRAAGLVARPLPLIVVAPRASGEEATRLRELARQSSVELDIRIGISDEELRDLYRRATATLYLAREEPFGLVSLEAQACGSPVVVADDGGLPETMLAGESGWVVSRDRPEMAARAIDALAAPELMRKVSARAREHGCAQTWERSTECIQRTLERVCAG